MVGTPDRLKALREQANPPISIRALAEEIGVSAPTYHRYESAKGFKGRYLPMDLARRIARVLGDRGINPDDVLRLAGVGENETGIDQLTAGEEQLLQRYRLLDPKRRKLALQVLAAMIQPVPHNDGRFVSV